MVTQQRRPDLPKKISKSLSITQELADDIQQRAIAETHGNFSFVIIRAVQAYLTTPIERVFGLDTVTIDPKSNERETAA